MANASKSEVALKIGESTYTLKFGRNAMASVESLFGGRPFNEIAMEPTVTVQRAMLWAALQRHHPGLDLLTVGDLLDEADDSEIGAKLGEALQLASVKNGRPQ